MADLTTQNAKFGDNNNTLLLKAATALQTLAEGGGPISGTTGTFSGAVTAGTVTVGSGGTTISNVKLFSRTLTNFAAPPQDATLIRITAVGVKVGDFAVVDYDRALDFNALLTAISSVYCGADYVDVYLSNFDVVNATDITGDIRVLVFMQP